MSNQYQAEIIRLHQFFVDWFTGRLPKTAEARAAFDEAMGDEFVIISPTGAVSGRGQTVDNIDKAHGAMSDISIWIENVTVRQQIGELVIVTYEEWQTRGKNTTRRLSTVLFQQAPQARYGLYWLHVHETWLNV